MFLNLSDIVDMILFVSEAKLSEDSFSEWNPRVCGKVRPSFSSAQ